MVSLPTVGDGVVTSTAPQSSITPGIIEQGANMRAHALGAVADDLMDVAKDQAKTQAADDLINQKVTRNADGSVNVENPASAPLIFGDAGKLYQDAIQTGTIAQHANALSQDFTQLHAQFPADPQGFRAAAEAHLQKTAQDVTGPIGQAVQAEGQQLLTQHVNAITDKAASLDVTTQASAISASQTSARDDVLAMARGGMSANDPALLARQAAYEHSVALRSANPLFGYSKEQAALDVQSFHSEVAANMLLHDVDKVYQDQGPNGGYQAALAKANDILTNPAYAMSQQDREAYYHKATADIRANEAIRHQDVAEARAALSELSMASAAGSPVSSDQIEQVAHAFDAAGDPGGRARTYSMFIRKPLNDSFGQQPLATQTQQLNALHGANAAAFVNSALIAKGYSPVAAAGIVGNTIHESGVDPTAVGDNGTSGGIAQFHNERLANLKAFAAERGKPASDLQTQVDFIDHELHTTETGTLAKLQAAKTPEEAGAAFIDYERPQGWSPQNPAGGLGYESRKALARQIYDGKPADMSMGPAGSMWLEANRQRTVATAAQAQWQTIMKDYNESNIRPPLQTVNDVVNAARASRNAALLDTIAHDSDRMDLAGQSARSPLALQQSNITDLTAAGNAGQLTPGHYQLITDLQRKYNAISEGLDKNPVATTVANFPDKGKDPGPLDMSSPENLAAGLKARSKVAQFAAQNWQTAPLSVLDQQDVKQVQAALQSPAGPAVLGGLASGLQPAELGTLFDKTKLADSITGMSRSGDPAKMNAAFSFMDSLQRQNPLQFDKQFPDGLRDLHAWQSLAAFNTPEATAKKMEAFFSPQEAEARKATDTAANDILAKVPPAQVVSKFSTGVIFGTTANPPAGEQGAVAAGALKAEYDQNFRDGFAVTSDAKMADGYAIDKLQQKYAVSPTNGNRVTAFAPEKYYPMVGGSFDWMAKQLDDTIAKATGADQRLRQHLNVNELKQLKGQDPTVGENPQRNFYNALTDLRLTPEEQNLFKMHQANVTGPGGVTNAEGSRSTLYQAVQEHDGKFYNIPTVWNGKREVEPYKRDDGTTMDVPNKTTLANVERVGWDKFPSYATPDEADARYQQMHAYMDKDIKFANDAKSAIGQRMYAAPRALVPDQTTAADVSNRRPPSYQVIIQDPNGRWGLMTNPTSGQVQRMRFDPAQPFAERAAQAERAREVLISPANSTMAMP
jgi:hypothetical protein